ncbi:putative transmembrane protein [Mycobacterium intracellulare 1956]|uniref:Putative transmembrane protein n=1 Tax=Mycobacterium intracellulare 1956 TaxID=1299331 RepID=X8CP61_MYCIT|nr:putative transmembrane protein [Mycobacterium intracellulare 1956]
MVRTPWPLFWLSMVQADIIGALFVLGFLRYALPPEDRIQLQDLPRLNLAIFATSLIVLFVAASVVNLKLLMPVFRWQRAATTCWPRPTRPPRNWPGAGRCGCRSTAPSPAW